MAIKQQSKKRKPWYVKLSPAERAERKTVRFMVVRIGRMRKILDGLIKSNIDLDFLKERTLFMIDSMFRRNDDNEK